MYQLYRIRISIGPIVHIVSEIKNFSRGFPRFCLDIYFLKKIFEVFEIVILPPLIDNVTRPIRT